MSGYGSYAPSPTGAGIWTGCVWINGKQRYLWRVVDHGGEVLEPNVTEAHDKAAALKFIKQAMRLHGRTKAIMTDSLRSYGAALKEIGAPDVQQTGPRRNNRAENCYFPFRRWIGRCSDFDE